VIKGHRALDLFLEKIKAICSPCKPEDKRVIPSPSGVLVLAISFFQTRPQTPTQNQSFQDSEFHHEAF